MERESSRVQAVACFFPPTDFLNYGEEGREVNCRRADGPLPPRLRAADHGPRAPPRVPARDFPVYHVTKNTPPTLIIHGDDDALVPIQQARLAIRALEEHTPCGLVVRPARATAGPASKRNSPSSPIGSIAPVPGSRRCPSHTAALPLTMLPGTCHLPASVPKRTVTTAQQDSGDPSSTGADTHGPLRASPAPRLAVPACSRLPRRRSGGLRAVLWERARRPRRGREIGDSGPAPTPAATPTPAPKKTFVVKVPPAAKYVISIPEAGTPPVQASGDQATLEVHGERFEVHALGGRRAERLCGAARDGGRLGAGGGRAHPRGHRLVHLVAADHGPGGEAVANGVVILTSSLGKVHQFQLTPAQAGEIQVLDVAQGKAEAMVALPLNVRDHQEVQVTLQGETFQTIPVGLPEVTAVVDTPARPRRPGGGHGRRARAPAARPAPQPTPGPPNQRGGASQFFQTLLGFIILGAVGYGVYAYGRSRAGPSKG